MTAQELAVARLARREDSAAIARIHNQGTAERIATFETEPRTPEDIERMLAERGDRYPTIVVERDGEVVAWAGAGS
jgi:L-amino acid N-acyltransferase YncA